MPPQLTDETIQLFIQFFWHIKAGNPLKANQLLAVARHTWGFESSGSSHHFLECGHYTASSSQTNQTHTKDSLKPTPAISDSLVSKLNFKKRRFDDFAAPKTTNSESAVVHNFVVAKKSTSESNINCDRVREVSSLDLPCAFLTSQLSARAQWHRGSTEDQKDKVAV